MVNRDKLFWGSCLALLTTAFAFTVITGIAYDVKQQFVLTNAQLGVFTGVFFIGFTISQAIFSPLCDTIGMRWIVRGAFVGHVAGALLLLVAPNYVFAVAGSLCCGLGAGLVEAGCNPLVATLYPNDKTSKLNHFHMWFPYGNLIAAIIVAVILVNLFDGWRGMLYLILVPALGYGLMMLREPFPQTEGAAAGVSVAGSFKALFAPIMLIMMPMMLLTASMELPPVSWVPPVLQAGGINGILVFGFIFGIMGTLRLLAPPVVRLLTPTGILFFGSILAVIGLWLFSQAETTLMAFATAAIWAAGIAYFWPTMLGLVSERNPKSGALGLGVMGAVGMLASFLVTPWMGNIADIEGHTTLREDSTRHVLVQAVEQLPPLAEGPRAEDVTKVVTEVRLVLDPVLEVFDGIQAAIDEELTMRRLPDSLKTDETETRRLAAIAAQDSLRDLKYLPAGETTKALRSISNVGVDAPVVQAAKKLLDPADLHGGRRSFAKLAPYGLILVFVFGFMFIRDRMTGGYKTVRLGSPED